MKICKTCQHRLLDSRGETLVETLGAILIAALSTALLFTCVVTSNRINSQTRVADDNYYNELSGAENYEISVSGATTINVTSLDGGASQVSAQLYSGSGAGKKLFSYKEVP